MPDPVMKMICSAVCSVSCSRFRFVDSSLINLVLAFQVFVPVLVNSIQRAKAARYNLGPDG